MAHQLKNLNARQYKCLELEMAHVEWTCVELAKEMGVSPKTVWQWKHSPIYQQELDRKIHERFKEQAKRAQRELENIAFDPETGKRDRLTALMYMMKCGNFEPAQKQEVQISSEGIVINIDNAKPEQ